MQKLVNAGKRDNRIRQLMGSILNPQDGGRPCASKDYFCYAKNLYEFVKNKILYVYDPTNVEFVEKSTAVLDNAVGDCDSMDILLASLLECAGLPTQFVTIKADPSRPNDFTHVYCRVQIPKYGWICADPIMPDKYFGWEPPFPNGRRFWPASADEVNQPLDTSPSVQFNGPDQPDMNPLGIGVSGLGGFWADAEKWLRRGGNKKKPVQTFLPSTAAPLSTDPNGQFATSGAYVPLTPVGQNFIQPVPSTQYGTPNSAAPIPYSMSGLAHGGGGGHGHGGGFRRGGWGGGYGWGYGGPVFDDSPDVYILPVVVPGVDQRSIVPPKDMSAQQEMQSDVSVGMRGMNGTFKGLGSTVNNGIIDMLNGKTLSDIQAFKASIDKSAANLPAVKAAVSAAPAGQKKDSANQTLARLTTALHDQQTEYENIRGQYNRFIDAARSVAGIIPGLSSYLPSRLSGLSAYTLADLSQSIVDSPPGQVMLSIAKYISNLLSSATAKASQIGGLLSSMASEFRATLKSSADSAVDTGKKVATVVAVLGALGAGFIAYKIGQGILGNVRQAQRDGNRAKEIAWSAIGNKAGASVA